VLYAVIDSALADRMAEVANRLREERRGCAMSKEGTAECRSQRKEEEAAYHVGESISNTRRNNFYAELSHRQLAMASFLEPQG
jgi:hypothetical protein